MTVFVMLDRGLGVFFCTAQKYFAYVGLTPPDFPPRNRDLTDQLVIHLSVVEAEDTDAFTPFAVYVTRTATISPPDQQALSRLMTPLMIFRPRRRIQAVILCRNPLPPGFNLDEARGSLRAIGLDVDDVDILTAFPSPALVITCNDVSDRVADLQQALAESIPRIFDAVQPDTPEATLGFAIVRAT